MKVFYSDLDNTLIYSYKHEIGERRKCVEVYQGREISFMTEFTWRVLKTLMEKLLFVPVTTRTLEQYQRIQLGISMPSYALVCNGGILLKDGEPDRCWYEESLRRIQEARTELELGMELLRADEKVCFEVRFVEKLFVFTKSAKPQETAERLRERLNLKLVHVFCNHKKVYVVPRGLEKGTAVRRLQEILDCKEAIAAGDSLFDLSMMDVVNVGFAPLDLREEAGCVKNVEFLSGGVFSDLLMERLIDAK